MGAAQTGWFRTESGTVLEMDLPLVDGIAHRVKLGEIVRVQRDGDRWVPWVDPATEVEADPQDAEAEGAAREELSKALNRIAELEAALEAAKAAHAEEVAVAVEAAIKECNQLKAAAEAKPKPAAKKDKAGE